MKRRWIIPLGVAVVVLLAALLWCFGKNNAVEETEEETYGSEEELVLSLMPCTVMVTAGENHASGVILEISDDEVTLITAGHLMEGYDQGIITFTTGNAGFGDVKYISDNPDICIMTFGTRYIDDSLLSELKAAKHSQDKYDELAKDDPVYLVGSAISTGSNAVSGRVAAKDFYVEDFDARMLYLYTDVMAGMSGCGVYDENGYLVGTLAGGNGAGEAVCVSLPQIYEKWEEIKNDKN